MIFDEDLLHKALHAYASGGEIERLQRVIDAVRNAIDNDRPKGWLKHCVIETRETVDPTDWLFRMSGEDVTARLDGYAVIPLEYLDDDEVMERVRASAKATLKERKKDA